MAKATTAAPGGKDRGKSTGKASAGGGRDRGRSQPARTAPTGESSNYFVGVVQELRKVTWPAGRDLRRMTQVVIVTVIIFAALIGGLDFLLGIVAKPLYSQPGTSQSTPVSVPTTLPPQTPTPKASASASPKTSPSTSASHPPAATPTP